MSYNKELDVLMFYSSKHVTANHSAAFDQDCFRSRQPLNKTEVFKFVDLYGVKWGQQLGQRKDVCCLLCRHNTRRHCSSLHLVINSDY